MSCLKGYIGIRVCSTDTAPDSGLYINSLPGISLESIDKIADKEQITYRGVWGDVQDEAWIRFKVDFISAITECFKIDSGCDYEEMICANKSILVNAWRYLLGNQLMLERIYSSRLNKFTTINIDGARELADLYQVEYDKALLQAVKLVDTSSCCMHCGGDPEVVTWLP